MTQSTRVCHYTSAQGLISIVQNHTLWATSAAFMNDADEMQTGARAISKNFEKRRSDFAPDEIEHVTGSGILSGTSVFDNFLLSAAKDPDNLTLWRNYGRSEVAYSVQLDASVDLAPLEIASGEAHPSPPPEYFPSEPDDFTQEGRPIYFTPDPDYILCLGGSWKEVSYIKDEDDAQVGGHLDAMIAQFRSRRGSGAIMIPTYALSNSPLDFMKDAGFADEREVRSVHWINPWWKFVRYRPSRFGVLPYIEVTGKADDERDWASEAKKLPINGVTIGPNAPSNAERALRQLLDQNGYGDAWIERSKTPYR